jgi:hypothetical protein
MENTTFQNQNDYNFDPKDAENIVHELSFPRLAGTEGEQKAMERIESKFKEIGVEFKKEPFNATKFWVSDFFRLGVIFIFILVSILVVLSIFAPEWNTLIIITTLVFAIYALRLAAGENIKPIGKLIATNNLLTKIPSQDQKRRILIYMGHHDSKSQPLTTIQRTICVTIGGASLLLVIIIFFVHSVFSIISTGSFPNVVIYTGYGFIGIVAIAAIPLAFNDVGNESPGALDNASSIATIYMLMKYFKSNPLKHTELWFLLTGAEEIGMMGAHEFVYKHRDEFIPNSTFAINFDMIGCKSCPIEVMATAGFPKPKKISPFLTQLAKKSAIKHNFPFREFYLPIGAATDRFLLTKVGVDALDFINQLAAFKTHSKNDTPNKFDANLAFQVGIVAADMGLEIDDLKSK